MKIEAVTRVREARATGGVLVSVVSGWEIGNLSRSGASAPAFAPDPTTWFAEFMAKAGVRAATLDANIAIAAALLPEPLHRDPGDWLLISTARALGVPIVTRDRKIIDYGALGHLNVIPC